MFEIQQADGKLNWRFEVQKYLASCHSGYESLTTLMYTSWVNIQLPTLISYQTYMESS